METHLQQYWINKCSSYVALQKGNNIYGETVSTGFIKHLKNWILIVMDVGFGKLEYFRCGHNRFLFFFPHIGSSVYL